MPPSSRVSPSLWPPSTMCFIPESPLLWQRFALHPFQTFISRALSVTALADFLCSANMFKWWLKCHLFSSAYNFSQLWSPACTFMSAPLFASINGAIRLNCYRTITIDITFIWDILFCGLLKCVLYRTELWIFENKWKLGVWGYLLN